MIKKIIFITIISSFILLSFISCTKKENYISDEVVSAGTISITSNGVFGIGDKSGGLHFYDLKFKESIMIPNTSKYDYNNVQNVAIYKNKIYLFEIKENKISLISMDTNGENVKLLNDNISPDLGENTIVYQQITSAYFTNNKCFASMKTDTIYNGRISSIIEIDLETNKISNIDEPINESDEGIYTLLGADENNIYYEKRTYINDILNFEDYISNNDIEESSNISNDYFMYSLENMNMTLISKNINTNDFDILIERTNSIAQTFNIDTKCFYFISNNSIYKVNVNGSYEKIIEEENLYSVNGEFENELYYSSKNKPAQIYPIRQIDNNIILRIEGKKVLFSIITKEDFKSKNYNNTIDISW